MQTDYMKIPAIPSSHELLSRDGCKSPPADKPAPSQGIPLRITIFQRGFTLVELAIVLFIVALLLGGMLLPLSAQQDVRSQGETQKQFTEAREALLGFAIANGRLPCPAWDGSGADNVNTFGDESFATGGNATNGLCGHPYDGFLPAAKLGLTPVDAQGFAVDAWGGNPINRIHYAVTTSNTNAFTKLNGMKTASMTALLPDLQICNTGTGIGAICAPNTALATDAVTIIYSVGKNAGTGGSSDDEKQNPNPNPAAVAPDPVFVSAQFGPNFDDQMIWLSKNILFNRMVSAGQLP